MNKENNSSLILKFKPIELSQMKQVESIRVSSGNTLYVHSFVSLFTWQEYEQYEIYIGDDAFIVKNGTFGENAYLFPCGSRDGKKRLIDSLLVSENLVFSSLTDDDRTFLESEYPDRFVFEECRDEYPYLYDKESQILMEGKEYKRLRHRINQGRAIAGEWNCQQITKDNIHRALALNKRWSEMQDSDDPADIPAVEKALKHFFELSMWGMIFSADGEDIAYVAGCFITPQIYDLCFCKVLDKRCDCFIKWLLYKALPEETKTVDSEDDLGIEGLRRHKLLRHPSELTRVWKAVLKDE